MRKLINKKGPDNIYILDNHMAYSIFLKIMRGRCDGITLKTFIDKKLHMEYTTGRSYYVGKRAPSFDNLISCSNTLGYEVCLIPKSLLKNMEVKTYEQKGQIIIEKVK